MTRNAGETVVYVGIVARRDTVENIHPDRRDLTRSVERWR
jgi:hypothetical protein